MIKNIRHTGIVVSNLEASLYFYCDLLGFKVVKRMDESGEYIDNISSLKNVKVTTIKMAAPDGNLIELLYYHSHQRFNISYREICDIGISHIAFSVDDLEQEYNRLTAAGVTFSAPPQLSPDGYAKVTFCKDPDGNLLELVEVLKKQVSNDYVSVIYDEKRTPKTEYPFKLASYLFNRFGMKAGMKLLEIGCGRGDFLDAFHKLNIECYGIDKTDYCKKYKDYLNVTCLDIMKNKLPYDDNTFDVVFHKSLLEHLYSPDGLMKETYRVLKPKGRVIILTPDWVSQTQVFYEDFTHCRPYDVTALNDLLKVYGFTEIKTELFYQLPILWRYPSLKIISRLLQLIFSTKMARRLTEITKIKFFRWSVELMVLGTGVKSG